MNTRANCPMAEFDYDAMVAAIDDFIRSTQEKRG